MKVMVPAEVAGEFAGDEEFAGFEAETVENFAAAVSRLLGRSADALFLPGASKPLDAETFEAIVAGFSGLDQPALILSAKGHLLWANPPAHEEGVAPSGKAEEFFEQASRHTFIESLARTVDERVLVRTIAYRGNRGYEVNFLPAGGREYAMAAVVFGKKRIGSAFYERIERLAEIATNLFPEDADALVRLASTDRAELIKSLIEKTVKETFRYDDFILRTVNVGTGELEAILARSGTGTSLSKRVLSIGTTGGSVAGHVAATGKPYLVEDASAESLWMSDIEGIQSAVVVPLKIGGKVVGTFAIEKKEGFAYDRYDLILATLFAGYITAALDMTDLVGLGQSVMVDKIVESVVEEVGDHIKGINDSVEELRRHNIGDSIAVTSRLESIRASASTIQEAIMRGARKAGTAAAPPPAAPEEILAEKKILIADDEPSILQSLGAILRSSGCVVDFAHDGFEAVEMATATPYDLVISDIKMPKMSGYEVYSSIKTKHPGTSVILMTAYGYDPTHSIVRARQEGLEAVLYKPFRAETLKKTLRQALKKKEPSQ